MISSQRKQSLRVITHWVFILALLLGQSLALGHDHGADQDPGGICALCLHAQQSDTVIPPTATGISVQQFPVADVRSALQAPPAVTELPFHSRAPPLISR